ncbi:sigma-70 family RNA polymerase sigma factor [Pontibacter sp. BT731]|uniref:RNA polymerase sigma factor n=1 Tax=Pontibacter coccineus TaxID=3063328 RepID=UPI0026E3214D|nr:sigma-70 family RNA polymerase sigma factor [Pontibacter sp. BT731]MDO6388691.1 sigma-70 family RNA polymerase sigma factor [Pontibacter sp. BT731]
MSGIDFQGETEQSLVDALRRGRQEMLGVLYDAYAPVLLGVISRIVPDAEVAEQVLQETFVAIWARIGVYDASKERLLTWGLAIARGIALEAVKTGRFSSSVNPASEPKPQQNNIVPLQQGHASQENFCSLDPLEKSALELIYLKGRSCSEAAGELHMTEAALKEVLKSAFTHLKADKSA